MNNIDFDAEIQKKERELHALLKAKEESVHLRLIRENKELREEIEHLKNRQPIFGSCNNWEAYPEGGGAVVHVNYSHLHLSKTPEIFTSLHGNCHIWITTGATSIYLATKDGFTVYVKGMSKEEMAQDNVVLRYQLYRTD